jgi:hypothetical protein
MTFLAWRRVHRVATGILAGLAALHSLLTAVLYQTWMAGAVWFLGTGLGLLLLALVNWAHVGLEPCRQPTARLVRWANIGFLASGVLAFVAVPEPQAMIIVAALALQAIAGHVTLPGPA